MSTVFQEVPTRARLGNLSAALVEAQRNAKSVVKDATNAFHKYAYASAEAIMTEGRAALNAAGLAAMQLDWSITSVDVEWTDADGKACKDQERTLHVAFALMHESGERLDSTVEVPILPEKGRPVDKALFAALTYAESYYLRGILCLPRISESDSIDSRDDTAHEPRRAAKSAPPTKPSGKPIPNKYAAPCTYCNADVDAGAGLARQDDDGKWRAIHKPCLTALRAETSREPGGEG